VRLWQLVQAASRQLDNLVHVVPAVRSSQPQSPPFAVSTYPQDTKSTVLFPSHTRGYALSTKQIECSLISGKQIMATAPTIIIGSDALACLFC
jgi:hypothetical protein